MTLREETEEREEKTLSPFATLSKNSKRAVEEKPCEIRTSFQVDRDRIIHSKSFRRLKGKAQVLLLPKGDHYRTRMTHTLEVSQIARTISRALKLNEDLTEAIALGHDLGHTPFGHAGEEALNEISHFHHSEQSLRVVEILESGRRKIKKGLNLTEEVKDGILKHSKGMSEILPKDESEGKKESESESKSIPKTLEGQVVRISDIIAYLNHDLDDAIRAGVLDIRDVPKEIKEIIGEEYGDRVDRMVKNIVFETRKFLERNVRGIFLSEDMLHAMERLRSFLFERVYTSDFLLREAKKAKRIVKELFFFYAENPKIFFQDKGEFGNPEDPLDVQIKDFISGMTDNFALTKWEEYFSLKPWGK